MVVSELAWMDEVDLDPEGHWLRMGTRNLGDRPWLVTDRARGRELALKRRLCVERHDEVFASEPGPEAELAGDETFRLVSGVLTDLGLAPVDDGPGLHPLDRAGRSVQEDLCVMRRDPSGWILAGGSLCFPSRWRLQEKMGLPLWAVHGPVDGYRSELSSRVDNLLDRLGDRIVRRRNWFVHPDPALFQPDRPPAGDPVIPTDRCGDDLHLRSERQTLRRLPASGWVLFTIRIQQVPLAEFWADERRRGELAAFLGGASAELAAHRGLAPAQVAALRRAV